MTGQLEIGIELSFGFEAARLRQQGAETPSSSFAKQESTPRKASPP